MQVSVSPKGANHVVKVDGKIVYTAKEASEAFRVSMNIQAHSRGLQLPFPQQSYPTVRNMVW
jgi:hypothetical protein